MHHLGVLYIAPFSSPVKEKFSFSFIKTDRESTAFLTTYRTYVKKKFLL